MKGNNTEVIAFLGSSTTAGKGEAYDWIGELRRRPENQNRTFVNFGVGGDLAYGALQRIPKVVSCRPDAIVIQVGGNDILATVFGNVRHVLVDVKRLSGVPSPDWFRKNLQLIVRQLKEKTSARIALISLQPIGEDPKPTHPIQRQLNELTEEYNAIIKDVARQEGVGYVPFYEALREQLAREPGRAFTEFHFSSFYKDAFRYFVLRQSGDEIAKKNGWRFHVDGGHLNSRSGVILANLVQEFLQRSARS